MATARALFACGAVNRSHGCVTMQPCGVLTYGVGGLLAHAASASPWTLHPAMPLAHPAGEVLTVASCAGLLVTGGTDCQLRIWPAGTAQDSPLYTQKLPSLVHCVAISAEGAGVVTAAAVDTAGHLVVVVGSMENGAVGSWRAADAVVVGASRRPGEGAVGGGAEVGVLAECVALSRPPGRPSRGAMMVCVGAVDGAVHVYLHEGGVVVPAVRLTGHSDWVRGLSFAAEGQDVLLASASQDKSVRVWRFTAGLLAGLASGSAHAAEFKPRARTFELPAGAGWVTAHLDAVLTGHDNAVNAVAWEPVVAGGAGRPLRLLSASMDRSLVVWARDGDGDGDGAGDGTGGVWASQARVGALGGNQTAIGFFSAAFAPASSAAGAAGALIVGHAANGALHGWREEQVGAWRPELMPSGHAGEVRDVAWDRTGTYLLSCSADQTTRVFAPWAGSWHEIARPQVHGYDMVALTTLPDRDHAIVSCGEEKALRVFYAPLRFLRVLKALSGVEDGQGDDKIAAERVEMASVPELGLANRPADLGGNINIPGGDEDGDEDLLGADRGGAPADPSVVDYGAVAPSRPPLEDSLVEVTLWAEAMKLYGHPNDLLAVAASPDGSLIASASKASEAQHASVRLWATATWTEAARLDAHSLSVVQLAFSPDGRFLLSCSRDRSVAVHRVGAGSFSTAQRAEEVHARIVWCGAWHPAGQVFASGSRDKTVKLFALLPAQDGTFALACTIPALEAEVRALDFNPAHGTLAVGLENGDLLLYAINIEPTGAVQATRTHRLQAAHQGAILRLKWKHPNTKGSSQVLATAGKDTTVRLWGF